MADTQTHAETLAGYRFIRKVETDRWYDNFAAVARTQQKDGVEPYAAEDIALSLFGITALLKSYTKIPRLRKFPPEVVLDKVLANLPESAERSLLVHTTDLRPSLSGAGTGPNGLSEIRMGMHQAYSARSERHSVRKVMEELANEKLPWMSSALPRIAIAEHTNPDLHYEFPDLALVMPVVIKLLPIEPVPVYFSDLLQKS